MRVPLSRVLLAILAFTLVLFACFYFFPLPALLIILGIPFILFFPGFVLLAAIAAKREDTGSTERIILSFVLSILVDSIIGLALNYTPFGITADSIIITGAAFIILVTVASLIRQSTLPRDEKVILEFDVNFLKPVSGVLNPTFSIIMILVIAGALGSGLYFAFTPKSHEAFTQFYIVKQDGALYSPSNLTVGDEAAIFIGISNHEGTQANYRIKILLNNNSYDETNQITLDDGQEWLEKIIFPIDSTGEKLMECILVKNDEPYLKPLRIWFSISDRVAASER